MLHTPLIAETPAEAHLRTRMPSEAAILRTMEQHGCGYEAAIEIRQASALARHRKRKAGGFRGADALGRHRLGPIELTDQQRDAAGYGLAPVVRLSRTSVFA